MIGIEVTLRDLNSNRTSTVNSEGKEIGVVVYALILVDGVTKALFGEKSTRT